jgi:hypothetical protein
VMINYIEKRFTIAYYGLFANLVSLDILVASVKLDVGTLLITIESAGQTEDRRITPQNVLRERQVPGK